MRTRRRWSELSPGKRRVMVVVGVVEGILKLAALVDLKRRPSTQIRGPKWAWVTSVAVVSSAGVLPIVYFIFGRRRQPQPSENGSAG